MRSEIGHPRIRSPTGRRQNGSPKFAAVRPRTPQQNQKSLPSQFGQKCDIKKAGNTRAKAGSSNERNNPYIILEMIADQMGAKIGTEKLRKLIATLASGMEPLRQEAQGDKLIKLIDEAHEDGKSRVLSVSRDGVALGLAPWSFFEMASVACISVLAGGNKLGTVYLGCVPETNQVTPHDSFSALSRSHPLLLVKTMCLPCGANCMPAQGLVSCPVLSL